MTRDGQEIPLKALAPWLAFILLIATSTVGAIRFFETKADAQEEHSRLAAWDEVGMLETQRDLCIIEIRYFLNLDRPLNREENERLEYLREKRDDIEARLRELRGTQRLGG